LRKVHILPTYRWCYYLRSFYIEQWAQCRAYKESSINAHCYSSLLSTFNESSGHWANATWVIFHLCSQIPQVQGTQCGVSPSPILLFTFRDSGRRWTKICRWQEDHQESKWG
jgi:hypothetical protein